MLIRIGEAGRVYDVDGLGLLLGARRDHASTPCATMLETLTAQAEASDREVIFRTWSVGVGAVGDMHTNPESYEAVLGGIDSPALIVSTKYTLGDFYSWLPLNDTLEQGEQRRIVEFQSAPRVRGLRLVPQRPRRASTSARCSSCSRRTRTSRASGPGRRTAARGAPAR